MSTYIETIQKLQAQGLDTLKQAQSVQLAAFNSFREIVATVPVTPMVPSMKNLPSFSELTELSTNFVQALVAQQTAFASELASIVTTAQKDAAAAFDQASKSVSATVSASE
jgi:hypothetical protein